MNPKSMIEKINEELLNTKRTPIHNESKENVIYLDTYFNSQSTNYYIENNELTTITEQMNALKEILSTYLEISYKKDEVDPMSLEILTRLEQKVGEIDQNIRKLELSTTESKTENRIRLDAIDKSLDKISDKLESVMTKDEFEKQVESGRFKKTSNIALGSLVVASIAAIASIVKLFF